MNYNIIFSPTGGTAKAADILIKAFGGEFQVIDLSKEVAPAALSENDTAFVSVPSYGGRVPAVAVERLSAITANGAKAVLVCVYGNREWEDTLTELQDTLEKCGFVCAAAVSAVAEHSVFRCFAQGRPDSDDTAELTEFAAKIKTKLSAGDFTVPALEGSHGTYKEYGGLPLKPEGSDKCVSCGKCASMCPVGAISSEAPSKTDKEKCISCMRCISVCPVSARDFDPEFMAGMAEKMAPVLGGHKKNHLFL